MPEAVVLDAQDRQGKGTRLARRLRKSKQIPAVLYGHGEATLPVALASDEITRLIRHGVRIVDLKTSKGTEKALLREVQFDHLGMEILHIDFARVSADERILIDVRVELRGTAPGISQGGMIQQPLHNLHIECLAIAIPDSIRVPMGELQLNQAIHVKDLKLPDGVVVKNDPDAIVVQCTPQVIEAEPAPGEAAPTGDSSEPEVIGRVKEAEEAEAE